MVYIFPREFGERFCSLCSTDGIMIDFLVPESILSLIVDYDCSLELVRFKRFGSIVVVHKQSNRVKITIFES